MDKPSIFMIVEHSFPNDTRVRKEAHALKAFYNVTVFALKRDAKKYHETVNGVEVFRIPELKLSKFKLKNRHIQKIFGAISYFLQYFYFTALSALLFLGTFPKRKYKVIHAHNPPDTLFLTGLIGKIFSVKFIFDHHDLSPELYLTRFSKNPDLVYKVLVLAEKLSCKLADTIISTNKSYKQIVISRHSIVPEKIHIVRNDPIVGDCLLSQDEAKDIRKDTNKKNLLYLGSINPQDGLDLLLKAFHFLVNDLNERNFFCTVLGDGDALPSVKQVARELNLLEYLDFKGLVFDRYKIKEYLYLSDICVEPASDNAVNRHSTFIKIMEYMAARKPIVAFDLAETRYSADGSALLVAPDDIKGFAHAIKQLFDKPQLREKLGRAGLERVHKELHWEKASLNLIDAYKSLFH